MRMIGVSVHLKRCNHTVSFPRAPLANLTKLDLSSNRIGVEGMQAFSTAISSGALGSLEKLLLGGNLASDSAKSAVKAVVSSRSINLTI